ncbi:hypothetical protein [Streptomyces sp. 8N706]|uniref:hypothetical protein n=1 Tax=Streptomyces sp. 8N706 TaxID=3457416 RepID=UPI003FD06458
MTTAERRRAAAERVRAAEEAIAELREGLRAVGVVLPSLRIDPVSCAAEEAQPLVELGRCNLATARQLAAVLRERRP